VDLERAQWTIAIKLAHTQKGRTHLQLEELNSIAKPTKPHHQTPPYTTMKSRNTLHGPYPTTSMANIRSPGQTTDPTVSLKG
jgi:hypothetical protein